MQLSQPFLLLFILALVLPETCATGHFLKKTSDAHRRAQFGGTFGGPVACAEQQSAVNQCMAECTNECFNLEDIGTLEEIGGNGGNIPFNMLTKQEGSSSDLFCKASMSSLCTINECCSNCGDAATAWTVCNLQALGYECDIQEILCDVEEVPGEEEEDGNILDTLLDENFTLLYEALNAAGLVSTLSSPGPYTVFAPTNQALTLLSQSTYGALLSEPDFLTEVLLYHVILGEIFTTDMIDGLVLTTVNGSNLTVSMPNMINNAKIVTGDIIVTNGVIHAIDSLLIPPADEGVETEEELEEDGDMEEGSLGTDASILDIVLSDPDFSMLFGILSAAGLYDTLSNAGPFTIFAPNNEAFAALEPAVVESLLMNVDLLTSIALNHVIDEVIPSSDLVDGAVLPTLSGGNVTVSLNPLMIDTATVTKADLYAKNGIIHMLDAVLFLPDNSSSYFDDDFTDDGDGDVSLDIELPYKSCKAQVVDLGDCFTREMCSQCVDGAFDSDGIASAESSLLSMNMGSIENDADFLGLFDELMEIHCNQTKTSFCRSTQCCPMCSDKLAEFFECALFAVDEMVDFLENVTSEFLPINDSAPALAYHCDFLEFSCNDDNTTNDNINSEGDNDTNESEQIQDEGSSASGADSGKEDGKENQEQAAIDSSSTESESSSSLRAVLIDLAFLITCPEGKTAATLKADEHSRSVELLTAAFGNFLTKLTKVVGQDLNPRLLKELSRKLASDLDPASAEIYDFQDLPCNNQTEVGRQPASNCIAVYGKYRVIADKEEDAQEVYSRFKNATVELVATGALQETLQETARENNQIVSFSVEGVSPVEDDSFDAFAEFGNLSEAAALSVSTVSPTEPPAVPMGILPLVEPKQVSSSNHACQSFPAMNLLVGLAASLLGLS